MSLLKEVKNRLRLLNDDNDKIVEDIIGNGKAVLNELVGVELDFEKEGLAKTLLLDYCRYDYNNSLEFFEGNNLQRINRLIFLEGAKTYGLDKQTEQKK